MNQLTISPNDFPAVEKCTYINAANVALMYRGASEGIVAWQEDVAENGSNNFDEAAEEAVFFGQTSLKANLLSSSVVFPFFILCCATGDDHIATPTTACCHFNT